MVAVPCFNKNGDFEIGCVPVFHNDVLPVCKVLEVLSLFCLFDFPLKICHDFL